MNNKVEIFKLAIKAGSVELSEEQCKFVIECFIKAEKLSGGYVKKDHKFVKHNHKGGLKKRGTMGPPTKTWTGRGLFIKEKMAELKNNGQDYKKNKATAQKVWAQLIDEEKQVWNNKSSSIEHKLPVQGLYVDYNKATPQEIFAQLIAEQKPMQGFYVDYNKATPQEQ